MQPVAYPVELKSKQNCPIQSRNVEQESRKKGFSEEHIQEKLPDRENSQATRRAESSENEYQLSGSRNTHSRNDRK